MSEVLAKLQDRLGYVFRDPALLELAVTHTSYLPEHPEVTESNQRLEFLGDAVLQLVLTEALLQRFPDDREGLLSKRRSSLSKGVFLAGIARELGLDVALRLGTSEEMSGGRLRPGALEDTFEAIVGAIYLDSDLPAVRQAILRFYGDLAARLSTGETEDNPKGRLQELVQPVHGNNAVRYQIVGIEGEDHAREYEVAVHLLDRLLGSGRGSSKKLAEESAARAALLRLAADPDQLSPQK